MRALETSFPLLQGGNPLSWGRGERGKENPRRTVEKRKGPLPRSREKESIKQKKKEKRRPKSPKKEER